MSAENFTDPALWQFLGFSALCILACLLAYEGGLRLWRVLRHHPVAHPLLTASIPLVAVLMSLDVSAEAWREGSQLLYWLLGPSIVALAMPIYRQRRTIAHAFKPVLQAVVIGGVIAPVVAILLALPFEPTRELVLALLLKSVTSAIAFPIAESIGGDPELAVGVVVTTGIVGSIVGPSIFRWLRISDARIVGLVLGVIAHAVGTARAIEMGARPGAFAGVALALSGLFVAVVVPLLLILFGAR